MKFEQNTNKFKSLRVIPISIKQANLYIKLHHRHHKGVQGAKFCIGLIDEDHYLHGVASVGRAVARNIAINIAEVTRLCTDGTKNGCSILYSACARTCRDMGYDKIQTYILESESGISLLASGWEFEAMTAGGSWNDYGERAGSRRADQPQCKKQRWIKKLSS